MATVGSFAGITIDSTELLSFGLDITVLYSQQDRPFNSSYLTHTGLGHRRSRFAVKVQTEAKFDSWLNLHQNYDKTPKQLVIAQNSEGFWIIESIDIDYTDMAAKHWTISVGLIG